MKGKNILLIEDDLDFINFVQKVIEDQGANFFKLESPSEAESFILENSIDLIILDLNFFEKDSEGQIILKRGEDTLINRQYDPKLSKIPVIVCTSENKGSTLVNVDSIGASDFLAKPTNSKSLVNKVNDNLNN